MVGIEVLEGAQSRAEVDTGVRSFGRACAVQESPMAMCFLQWGKHAEGGEFSHQEPLQLLGLSLCTAAVTRQSSPSGHLV